MEQTCGDLNPSLLTSRYASQSILINNDGHPKNVQYMFSNLNEMYIMIKQNWSDKEEIFRKSKILKNCGIIVEEDFSRAAKFRRKELEKLVKEIKQLSPEKKCVFK